MIFIKKTKKKTKRIRVGPKCSYSRDKDMWETKSELYSQAEPGTKKKKKKTKRDKVATKQQFNKVQRKRQCTNQNQSSNQNAKIKNIPNRR